MKQMNAIQVTITIQHKNNDVSGNAACTLE